MGSSQDLGGAPLPEGPRSSQGKPGGRGGSLEECPAEGQGEGGLAAGKAQGSMGRKCPFLGPQRDESSEEWRRPGEREGGNRKGGETESIAGRKERVNPLRGQKRQRAEGWVSEEKG